MSFLEEFASTCNKKSNANPREMFPRPIGELVQTVLKQAVMAAWGEGSITALEAWWIIQREGLQHK